MKISSILVSLFSLVLTWYLLLSGIEATDRQVSFWVRNSCSFSIWPAMAPNAGHPVIGHGGFYLEPGEVKQVIAPGSWSGRFWGRTGCDFNNSSWGSGCETGDCEGELACNGLIGTPPATLVQVALQADKAKPSFYDVSLVDGYNIPVSVQSHPWSSKCFISGCSKDVNQICPPELQVINTHRNKVVACKSACLAFNNDQFCCRNQYGTPDKCKPNLYSKIFKQACPSYYSYAYDSPPPLFTCSSSNYVISFCPADDGWVSKEILNSTGTTSSS